MARSGAMTQSLSVLLLCSLLAAVPGVRMMMKHNVTGAWTGKTAGPRQCRTDGGVHVWVEHREACGHSQLPPEALGCHLYDFQWGRMMGALGPATEVHWQGGNWGMKQFLYHSGSSGLCGEPYRMPDFCSRAIISELSTVYDGVQRKASLSAGAKVLLSTKDERCEDFSGSSPDDVYQGVLVSSERWKACWSLAQDWRRMWCSKYEKCSCNPWSGECNTEGKIQCCRDQYQLFLDVHPRESSAYFGAAVTPQTARTYFSLSARSAPAPSQQPWGVLRLAHRASPARGLPTLFLEYSSHATFLDSLAMIDLCQVHNGVSANGGGELVIGRSGFQIDFGRFGPGVQPPPRSPMDMVMRIQALVSKVCNPGFTKKIDKKIKKWLGRAMR